MSIHKNVNEILNNITITTPCDITNIINNIFYDIYNTELDKMNEIYYLNNCNVIADILYNLKSKIMTNINNNTFNKYLINIIQDKFESLKPNEYDYNHTNFDELYECYLHKYIILIGHLYERKLISLRVISQIVYETISIKDRNPHKINISAVCSLLLIINNIIRESTYGKLLISHFIKRLNVLKYTKINNEYIYDNITQLQINYVENMKDSDIISNMSTYYKIIKVDKEEYIIYYDDFVKNYEIPLLYNGEVDNNIIGDFDMLNYYIIINALSSIPVSCFSSDLSIDNIDKIKKISNVLGINKKYINIINDD
jgi:hypothetical protein